MLTLELLSLISYEVHLSDTETVNKLTSLKKTFHLCWTHPDFTEASQKLLMSAEVIEYKAQFFFKVFIYFLFYFRFYIHTEDFPAHSLGSSVWLPPHPHPLFFPER